METVLKAIADWIKGILTAGIMSNLSGLFDAVNEQVGDIAQQVGTRPSAFEPRVFAMIESLSRNVVLPIAGIILTFIACYELIEMITQHNNMAQFEPALIMRWIFKTAVSVWFISNTFDIVMAVFDLTQKVVSDSSGIIAGNTRVNEIGLSMLEASLMQMDVGPLFGLFLQSFFIGITMRILSIVIFVIVYGRMIEIYCMVSLAPIPMATWGNHEQSHMGQNYLKCLFALGFQGFLILICVAIYAVLIQNVAISGDAINSIWGIVGYTVLLCFSLFKTSSVTKSVLVYFCSSRFDQGEVKSGFQPDKAAAHLLRNGGTDWSAAFLFAPRFRRQLCRYPWHDGSYAPGFFSRYVREKWSAAGKAAVILCPGAIPAPENPAL